MIISTDRKATEFYFTSNHCICNALRDLVPFLQFKKRENIHRGVIYLVTLLHGRFLRFLNSTNVTKLCKASHFIYVTFSGLFWDFNVCQF